MGGQQPGENGRKPLRQLRAVSRSLPKVVRWGAGVVVTLLLVLFIASYFLDEPLRRSMEVKMNSKLKGYSVRLPKLHFQLIGFSLTLKGLTVFQQANPQPPIALFPELRASVNWHETLAGRFVAEFELDRPEVRIDLRQLKSEAASTVPLKEQGWQQAIEAVYPLKINVLTIHDGTVTYIDQDPKRPLRLSHLNLKAGNIRNVRLPDKVYPSSFHLETAIFGTGRGVIDGKANFLAEPYPGVNARMTLEKVPLDHFKQIIARANLSIRNGLFSAAGEAEYAPHVKRAHLKELAIEGMAIDYIHSPRTAAAEQRRAEQVGKAAKQVSKSEMQLRIDEVRLTRCTVGMVNESARHPYRVFLTDADLLLTNLSNRSSQGTAKADLRGKFMGSGATRVTARFRPNKKGPDLDLNLKIEDTRLTDMNDLLRAYGDFDVTAGMFSLYSELHVKDDAISGYIKPFFKDMRVYDRRKDKEKAVSHKMYEMLVGGVAKLLERRPVGEVATKADISGTIEQPHVSAWQIIGRLIRNAFFKAILPGFEKEASGPPRR
ncbi:MAG TPA: DUF748 domain-containing protein [Geobacteraceae bacterium]